MSLDLHTELKEKMCLLDEATQSLDPLGEQVAITDNSYRMALSKQELLARAKNIPVTLIPDICRGLDEVAIPRLESKLAESKLKSTQELINSLKLQIRVLENQIAREWGQAGRV